MTVWRYNDTKPRHDAGVATWVWKAAQDNLLAAISDRKARQRDIAVFYSDALPVPCIDWHMVNHAILARYKPSGLVRIKEMAWKIARREKAGA
jgi:hypothetical protein